MKKAMVIACAWAALLAFAVCSSQGICHADTVDTPAYMPGELLVTLDTKAESKAQGVATDVVGQVDAVGGADLVDQPVGQSQVLTVELEDKADMQQACDEIADIPGVSDVQPNYIYRELESEITGLSVSDTYAYKQYYLESFLKASGANVKAAWTKARCGSSAKDSKVTVAVLDSGFKLDHADLAPNMLTSLAWDAAKYAKISGSQTANPNHGTHVAGIIGAVANNAAGIAGVSYNAKVLPVKVFNDSGASTSLSLRKAYNYLFDLVDKGELDDLHVINVSLGSYTGSDAVLEASIKRARNKYDIVTVCAGGNGYNDSDDIQDSSLVGTPRTTKIYPADFDACVSVTALDKDGTNAAWSDYNEFKDISAPGVDICSTYSNGKYASGSGTSMAAPIVSGALALLWAKNPDLTVDQALKALYATAVKIDKASNASGVTSGSHGCVDAAAALDYIDGLVSLRTSTVKVAKATFTGKKLTPKPVVKLGSKTLVQGVDYKVRYRNNKNAGTATLYVSGKGDYTGTVAKNFKIVLPAKVKKVKKAKVKKLRVSLKTPRKVKAAYKKVAGATGYQVRYAKAGSGVWKKAKTCKRTWASPKLKSKTRYYVSVRPFVKYGGKRFYGKWSATKRITTR